MIKQQKQPRKQLNKFARFSGMAFQMGITIVVGVVIGQYFDKKYPNENNIYTLVFALLFTGASLYAVIRQAIKLGNE